MAAILGVPVHLLTRDSVEQMSNPYRRESILADARSFTMPKAAPKTQDAYLHDMLEAARLIHDYTTGVSFEEFWHNSEKRDAVALRISVLASPRTRSTR